MGLFSSPADRLGQLPRRTAQEAAPWIQRLARLGYAARGVVYVVVGGLAAQAALSRAERPEGSEGALLTILRQPGGKALLGVVALGLAGYVLWRLVQALLDPEHKGSEAKGIATRIGYLLSALLHAGLTVEAVRLLRGTGGGAGGDQRAAHWTATALDQPLGRWLVGLAGAGIIAFGLYELYRGITIDFGERLELSRQDPATRQRIIRLGRAGYMARGVVFGIIGWFVVQAALRYDPQQAQGLEGALLTLRNQAYGPWLLGAVALGLIAYGLFQLVNARFRSIRPA